MSAERRDLNLIDRRNDGFSLFSRKTWRFPKDLVLRQPKREPYDAMIYNNSAGALSPHGDKPTSASRAIAASLSVKKRKFVARCGPGAEAAGRTARSIRKWPPVQNSATLGYRLSLR